MMRILEELVRATPIPRMVKVKQYFPDQRLDELEVNLIEQLSEKITADLVKPGMEIAVAVGSRGLDKIVEMTKTTVDFLKEKGAKPFIVPCMGSHGGATAAGQKVVLEELGIKEDVVGAEIRSSMEVVELGQLDNGLPVYIDKLAYEADGIVAINRVKPHTAFRGAVESGIQKMITIGLGKQKGAEACHRLGFKYMADFIPKMAEMIIEQTPILFTIASVENAFDEVVKLEVMLPGEIAEKEPPLLEYAREKMPKLYFDQIDVLIIDEIGKNISGDGMDPNITGRYPTPYAEGGPDVSKMVVLDLTPQSKGNANGVGTADFTTQRLVDKIDLEATYANGLTSTVVGPTHISTTMPNDRTAIQAAIKTCNVLDFNTARVVRIKNTAEIGEIEVSENMLKDIRGNPNLEQISGGYDVIFDQQGNII